MKQHALSFWLLLCVIVALAANSSAAEPAKPYLLHLPGVGGHMRIDDVLTDGLARGGLDAEIEIYDWTDGNPGLPALGNYQRNQAEAQKIADRIANIFRLDPHRRIILSSHSGGGGMAVWALEKLPDDVRIDTLLLLAPALSPEYDLSKALAHVGGKAFVFSSTLDPVNGLGTRNFGTMDRVKTEAAGNVGFRKPASGDPAQYAKLVALPYNPSWTRAGNSGDHIGTMSRLFARSMLAPLLLKGELPEIPPATQPTTAPAEAADGK